MSNYNIDKHLNNRFRTRKPISHSLIYKSTDHLSSQLELVQIETFYNYKNQNFFFDTN